MSFSLYDNFNNYDLTYFLADSRLYFCLFFKTKGEKFILPESRLENCKAANYLDVGVNDT